MRLPIVLLAATVFITGCTSIDKGKSLQQFKYEIGTTTRDQVVEVLGLPDVTENGESMDMLGYKGKADGSHLFIPMPVAFTRISPDTVQAFYTDIGPKRQEQIKKCEVLFFFSKDKKLINVTKPSSEGKQ